MVARLLKRTPSAMLPDWDLRDGELDGVDVATPIASHPVHELLWNSAEIYPDRVCVDFLGKTHSYRAMANLADHIAFALQERGLQKGDRVGIMLPNCHYFVAFYYGILKAGGVVVNFNPLQSERDVLAQAGDADCFAMVTLDLVATLPKALACLRAEHTQKLIICSMTEGLDFAKRLLFPMLKGKELADIPSDKGVVLFRELITSQNKPQPVDINPEEDLAVLQYTGGTTGQPKGAMLTHANLSANTDQLTRWYPAWKPGGEVMLGVLPLFHVFAMTVVMNGAVAKGASMVLLPKFDPKMVFASLKRTKPTLFPGVPALFQSLAKSPKAPLLQSVNLCISGGAALPLAVKQEFENVSGAILIEGYGLTEASPVTHCNPVMADGRTGTIGRPLPGTQFCLRDKDDPSNLVPPGAAGELCIKGPQVMKGYWKRPDDTKASFVDGWLRTGDVAMVDEDGYASIIDRIKDLIIVSGFNVYPRMVEDAIQAFDEVEAVSVIGVPDQARGEVPKAFIKLRDDVTGDFEAIKSSMLERLRAELEPHQMPRSLEFRDELPRTMVGKLSKKELRAES